MRISIHQALLLLLPLLGHGFRLPPPPPLSPSALSSTTLAATAPLLRASALRLQEADDAAAAAPSPPSGGGGDLETYNDAEKRGFELFQAGEHERAIRMFELAQTLPGEGVDLERVKQGGMIGSAFAPPNPREWAEDRFATAEQKLIAQYNIACCYAAMGDKRQAIELLRAYAAKVGEPLNQVNEMLLDEDLVSVRDELRQLREEYKSDNKPKGLFGLTNPLREISDTLGVEWKD